MFALNTNKNMTPLNTFVNCLLGRWMTAESIMDAADIDNNGKIEFEEFVHLCKDILRLKLTLTEIEEVFNNVDKDCSGDVSVEEFKQVIGDAMVAIESTTLSNTQAYISENEEAITFVADTKLVALVAHNQMKPAMMAFVAKHRDFFKTVRIVTTGSTGSALQKKLGLSIALKVSSGPLGGDQEIGAMVTRDEVSAAFFFVDPLSSHPHEADIRALTRICDVHNCAVATNPSTGEALVHAFLHSPEHTLSLHKQRKRRQSMLVQAYRQSQTSVIMDVTKEQGNM